MSLQKFMVRSEDNGREVEVISSDARQAAETAVEEWDREECDYPVASGGPIDVKVTRKDGTYTQFRVYGEFVPSYRAEG